MARPRCSLQRESRRGATRPTRRSCGAVPRRILEIQNGCRKFTDGCAVRPTHKLSLLSTASTRSLSIPLRPDSGHFGRSESRQERTPKRKCFLKDSALGRDGFVLDDWAIPKVPWNERSRPCVRQQRWDRRGEGERDGSPDGENSRSGDGARLRPRNIGRAAWGGK
jgi:hypothetical protein